MVNARSPSLQPRHASSYTGTFFSLFDKRRHTSISSLPKKPFSTLTGKSIQNKPSENLLNRIRMSSLASVASSMNIPSQRRNDVSSQRKQQRTGRRNDKFLSMWKNSDPTTEVIRSHSCLLM